MCPTAGGPAAPALVHPQLGQPQEAQSAGRLPSSGRVTKASPGQGSDQLFLLQFVVTPSPSAPPVLPALPLRTALSGPQRPRPVPLSPWPLCRRAWEGRVCSQCLDGAHCERTEYPKPQTLQSSGVWKLMSHPQRSTTQREGSSLEASPWAESLASQPRSISFVAVGKLLKLSEPQSPDP